VRLVSRECDLPLPTALRFSLAGIADGSDELHPESGFFSLLLIKGLEVTSQDGHVCSNLGAGSSLYWHLYRRCLKLDQVLLEQKAGIFSGELH